MATAGHGAGPSSPTNIAALERREAESSDRIARLNAALDTLSLGFLLYDRDHRLLVVNRRYHEIHRLPPGAVTPGMPAREGLRRNVVAENGSDRREAEPIAEIDALMGADAVPTRIRHLADGRIVAIEIQPIHGGGFVAILHGLRDLGVRSAMDDFGSGYSSLSYLRSFPCDKMKVDQSFTRDLKVEQGSGFIVRTVVSLASSLGMTTTAEGFETPEQLAWLREEGCDEVQGCLFSPSVPASALPALPETWNGRERRAA